MQNAQTYRNAKRQFVYLWWEEINGNFDFWEKTNGISRSITRRKYLNRVDKYNLISFLEPNS
jgi:hypothetical protein